MSNVKLKMLNKFLITNSKFLFSIFVCCLLLVISSKLVYANSLADERAKLRNEIRRLSIKLKTVKNEVHRQKLKKLMRGYKKRLAVVEGKRVEQQRAQQRSQQRARTELGLGIGLKGGAAYGEVGLNYAMSPVVLRGGLGYGIGNNYSLLGLRGGAAYPLSALHYAALDVTYGNYSNRVTLPGAGTVGSGSTVGIGIVYGRKVMPNIIAEIGYSTNLGVLASINYLLNF